MRRTVPLTPLRLAASVDLVAMRGLELTLCSARLTLAIVLRATALLAICAACIASVAVAQEPIQGPITSHDGHARIIADAFVRANTVRVIVSCPSGGSQTCQGRGSVRTRRKVRVRSGSPKRVVVFARVRFDGLAPGTQRVIRTELLAPAYVRRHGLPLDALGRVINDVPGGPVPTVDLIRLKRQST